MNILKVQKLELLADSLVPNNLKTTSPQFYGLVKSFLRNIENVQSSINNNFLDTIDISKIKNSDILRIYIDTYVAQLNFDDDVDVSILNDVAKVSKDISTRKGTILLYSILTKLLIYLLPNIGATYSTKIEQLKYATDEGTIKALEEEIEVLKINNYDLGYLQYYNLNSDGITYQYFDDTNPNNEDITPFKYKIETDYEESIFNKYFKPFCHPLGWEMEFISVINVLFLDKAEIYAQMTIYDCFVLPPFNVGSDVYVSEDNIGNTIKYPFTVYDDTVLDVDSDNLYIYQSIVSDVSKVVIEDGKVLYKFKNFSTEQPYSIGQSVPLKNKIGNYEDANALDYYLQSPDSGGLALVGQEYRYNNKISNWNGGVITNNGNNLVVYKEIISNVKSI